MRRALSIDSETTDVERVSKIGEVLLSITVYKETIVLRLTTIKVYNQGIINGRRC